MATFMAATVHEKKIAAKRPGAKEGGREEEKSRLGIASRLDQPARLRGSKNWCEKAFLVCNGTPGEPGRFPCHGAAVGKFL
jgi:hypothetical protein